MADQFTYAKLPSDPCLTQEQMNAYIDGKLSAADQHACEKHMADCAMCEDALEGLLLVKDRSVLAVPVTTGATAPTEGKVVPLHQPQPKRRLFYAAAAVLVLVLGATFLIRNMQQPDGSAMAENSAMDSSSGEFKLSPAPGAKYDSTLANAVTINDPNRPAEENFKKMPEGTNGPMQMQPETPRMAPAPKVQDYRNDDVEDEVVFDTDAEEITFAEATEKNEEPAPAQDGDLKEAETKEEDKKATFWEKTKVAIEQSGGVVNRSEQQKQPKDQYVDKPETKPDAVKSNADVPASPQQPTMVNGTASGNVQNDGVGAATDSTSTLASQNDLELSYQNGMNLLNSGQANAAITMFDKVLLDKNHPRYEDAEFQKANALIKANRKAEAKVLLQSIEAKKGKHAAEATELLKTL